MKKFTLFAFAVMSFSSYANISFDEKHWEFFTKSHEVKEYQGKDSIKIDNGLAALKDVKFKNGTIEFDVFLPNAQAFPGVRFRITDQYNMESFFLRPHLTGKPDANQAAPVVNGITAFQLYFGKAYSFPYEYKFDDWTHVKLLVKDDKAQVFLDHSEKPHHSWYLKHTPAEGSVAIGGSFAPAHYANFAIDTSTPELVEFEAEKVPVLDGAVKQWLVSDKFDEKELKDINNFSKLISERKWPYLVKEEERGVANITWEVNIAEGEGNTVFAKLDIESEADQYKILNFGYSDRAVVIVNGKPIYKGTKRWRTRDYRYLGTLGLFDAIYVPLKKGKNELLVAVSEDFGGWAIAGKFEDETGIKISTKAP